MSLVPARYNFTILPGATFYKRIFYELEGAVVDLTEHKVTLILKDEPDGKVLLSLNSAENEANIKLGGKLGTIDITIADKETSELTWTQAIYEIFVTDETLLPHRTDVIVRGAFKVIPF